MIKGVDEWKVLCSFFQIFVLVFSGFAFSLFLNDNFVSGAGTGDSAVELEFNAGKKISSNLAPSGSTRYTIKNPASYKSIKVGGTPYPNPERIMVSPDGTGKLIYDSGKELPMGVEQVKNAQTEFGGNLVGQRETKILGTTWHGATAHLVQGVQWALLAAGAIQLIGNVAGLEKDTTNALTIAVTAGIMAGKGLAALGPSGGGQISSTFFATKSGQITAGLVVAVVVFVLLYKKEKKETISFACLPYEPPLGGQKCEECNNDPYRPCSEYRCKSLGQACQLLNVGTKEEKWAWIK